VSSFLIGIVFAKNLSQEDNTPPSFYTKDFTLPALPQRPLRGL
jgi:hypothetical protein